MEPLKILNVLPDKWHLLFEMQILSKKVGYLAVFWLTLIMKFVAGALTKNPAMTLQTKHSYLQSIWISYLCI